jgi:hypothetical protein
MAFDRLRAQALLRAFAMIKACLEGPFSSFRSMKLISL